MSSVTSTDGPAFRPWHFFVVLTLLAATAAVLTSRTVTPEHLIMLSVTIFAAGGAALAAYRTLLPLVGRERRLSRESLGHRARVALEREKQLVLRSIKELEFDRAMGKIAPEDFDDMSRRLRARALSLMQQLETDRVAPRERLERELAERLREDRSAREARAGGAAKTTAAEALHGHAAMDAAAAGADWGRAPVPGVTCASCGAQNDDDARFCKACGTRLEPREGSAQSGIVRSIVIAILLCLGGAAFVQAQMPDLSQMSGRPLPSADLPAGTVSVRVIRGALSNNVAGVEVRLDGGPQPLTAQTDANGRASFSGLASGATWRASATVDGERLESQPFTLPTTGGIRMLLVAGLASGTGGAAGAGAGAVAAPSSGAASSAVGGAEGASASAAPGGAAGSAGARAAGAAPAVPGEVTLGRQSRVVIELAEESIEVYGLFELANAGAAPVMPAKSIVFEMPAGARNTTVLEGSTPQAKASGMRVTVTGPFAPGGTPVQIAYRYPYDGDTVRLSQVLPLRLSQMTVIVRKLEGLTLTLANAQGQRDVPLEGRRYLVVNGGPLEAGAPLVLTLRGLPHRPAWPRYVALGLALAIVIGGVLIAFRSAPDAADEVEGRALRTRRATVFEQLLSLERRRTGKVRDDPGPLARRDELMSEIEEIDERLATITPPASARAEGARVEGGGAKVAAASSEQSSERLGARPVAR